MSDAEVDTVDAVAPAVPAPDSPLTVAEVVALLRTQIRRGDLLPRERLVEAQIAERIGVRRPTVRAALLELAAEGLVVHEPHRGARVRSYSLDEAIDIIEARIALQALAAQKAALRGTADERRELLAALEHYRDAAEQPEMYDVLQAGHALLAQVQRMSRHEVAGGILDRLAANNIDGPPFVVPEVRDEVVDAVSKVAGAVLARDPDGAFWAAIDNLEIVVRAMESRRDLDVDS